MKNTNLIIGEINTYKTTGIMFNEVLKSIKSGYINREFHPGQ